MHKFINLLMLVITIVFIFFILKYYTSSRNTDNKIYNRSNIDQIIKEKSFNLPILKNDTDNVIEFNNSFENEINEGKKRSFWNLIKIK